MSVIILYNTFYGNDMGSVYPSILVQSQEKFPYITPKSVLARLAYCQKPCLTKFLKIS
ncbi:MAG: hypothetical protein ACKPJK_27985 [Microcystis panniformis]